MSIIRVRACSLCRLPGHTRRTCQGRELAQATREPQSPASKFSSPKSVMVQYTPEQEKSAHVVDLRSHAEARLWQELPVYKEKSPAQIERRTVSFAKLVLAANAASPLPASKSNRSFRLASVWQRPRPVLLNRIRSRADALTASFLYFFTPHRAAIAVALVFFVAVPFPALGYYQKWRETGGLLVEQSTNGFLALHASTMAAFQSDVGVAEAELQTALESFAHAQTIIDNNYDLIFRLVEKLPVIGAEVTSREQLLMAGHHLALGNTYLVKGIGEATQNTDALAPTSRLALIRTHMKSAIPQYHEALRALMAVEPSALPPNYQEPLRQFTLLFGALINDMEHLVDLSGALQTMFGHEQLRRYLVVFQNEHELRPTGGFMGSFAIVDVQKGKLVGVEAPSGGTYDVQGQTACVIPPLPLQLINTQWYLHDANWFPDFAQSARQIASFYRQSRGVTVDGVIAVNASVLERLLRVTGPIHIDAPDLTLTAADAIDTLQYEVEEGHEDPTRPKAVIGAALQAIIERLSSLERVDILRLLLELEGALDQREIQLFMFDSEVENRLKNLRWTGELLPVAPKEDYLMVVNSNIGGEKTDAVIKQTIAHEAVVGVDGSITDTVVIRREHGGTPGVPRTGVPNIDYLRVYVPQGAELIAAGGFSFPEEESFLVPPHDCHENESIEAARRQERYQRDTGVRIETDGDKTVFGHWVTTKPGEMSEAYLTYRLPFTAYDTALTADMSASSSWIAKAKNFSHKNTSPYRLVVQKQSGITSNLRARVIYPAESDWIPVWRSRADIDFAKNGGTLETTLTSDITLGILMQQGVVSKK